MKLILSSCDFRNEKSVEFIYLNKLDFTELSQDLFNIIADNMEVVLRQETQGQKILNAGMMV
ncbi:MAG: hypothetical protein ACI4VW_07705 [Acutalibacteraceae bacterium]